MNANTDTMYNDANTAKTDAKWESKRERSEDGRQDKHQDHCAEDGILNYYYYVIFVMNFFDCERMQRSPIHSFVVVVVFDFQVCEIFVLNEGKLKHVDKTCWQNLLTDKTCWQNLLTKPVHKICWQNIFNKICWQNLLSNWSHDMVLKKMTYSWQTWDMVLTNLK